MLLTGRAYPQQEISVHQPQNFGDALSRSWSIRVLGAYLEQQFCTAAVDECAGWAHRTGRSRTQFESHGRGVPRQPGSHQSTRPRRTYATWAQRDWRERTRDGPIARQPPRFTLTTTPASRAADLASRSRVQSRQPDRSDPPQPI
jgi:hypothetical protein